MEEEISYIDTSTVLTEMGSAFVPRFKYRGKRGKVAAAKKRPAEGVGGGHGGIHTLAVAQYLLRRYPWLPSREASA